VDPVSYQHTGQQDHRQPRKSRCPVPNLMPIHRHNCSLAPCPRMANPHRRLASSPPRLSALPPLPTTPYTTTVSHFPGPSTNTLWSHPIRPMATRNRYQLPLWNRNNIFLPLPFPLQKPDTGMRQTLVGYHSRLYYTITIQRREGSHGIDQLREKHRLGLLQNGEM
jgi:hypothetical protein